MSGRLSGQTQELMALLRQGHQMNRADIQGQFDLDVLHAQTLGRRACKHLRDRLGIDAGPVLHPGETHRRYQLIKTADEHDNAMGACVERGNGHLRSSGSYPRSTASLPKAERERAMAMTQQRLTDALAVVAGLQTEFLALMPGAKPLALEGGDSAN